MLVKISQIQQPTPNVYLYAGEQMDWNVSLYYLRARLLNQAVGRFVTLDPSPGSMLQPLSLNGYLYADANPSNRYDPSGLLAAIDPLTLGRLVHNKIAADFELKTMLDGGFPLTNYYSVHSILAARGGGCTVYMLLCVISKPDLTNVTSKDVYEIKTVKTGWLAGYVILQYYLLLLNSSDASVPIWHPGVSYIPMSPIDIGPDIYVDVLAPDAGVILYEAHDRKREKQEISEKVTNELKIQLKQFNLLPSFTAGIYFW